MNIHRFITAPMMDWSDRHCRYLWRLLTQHTLFYTEMVTAPALVHNDKTYLLDYNDEEHPIALQVGGSDPIELANAARLAERWGYDEINLNCGCPSDRVQNGMIGACLMRHPLLVADGIKAMQDACSIPVTIKHRIGVDDMEDYAGLIGFVEPVADAGCQVFIVHARKAWLKGLSPKENRSVPPLDYELVYRLKQERPDLTIIINGGITNTSSVYDHLTQVDGVMIGREAYHNPYCLAAVDSLFFDSQRPIVSRHQVALDYLDYCEQQLVKGVRIQALSRHLLGLFQGLPGARKFKRHISEQVHRPGASLDCLYHALSFVNTSTSDSHSTQ